MTKHHQTTTEAERNGLSLKEAISESISRGKLVSGATNTNPNPSSMVPTFANPFWIEMATQSKRFKLYAMVVVVTTVTAPPTKIVNTERVGMALQDMDIVKDLLVRRGESVPLGFECPIMCV
ncbi:ABC transporter G family member 6 [Vigna angularis]|uniref:ABC transporter G family member 6 n=1 Tax=Phaseolus angularis TaxID=3914 RepID=A0A8T0L9G4_PHAAN|nr:ABC transporter G family member 6 [Vigna angularis]